MIFFFVIIVELCNFFLCKMTLQHTPLHLVTVEGNLEFITCVKTMELALSYKGFIYELRFFLKEMTPQHTPLRLLTAEAIWEFIIYVKPIEFAPLYKSFTYQLRFF